MASNTIDQEPIIKHSNALYLINSIIQIRSKLLREGDDSNLLRQIEEIYPSTPLRSRIERKRQDWYSEGFPSWTTNQPYAQHDQSKDRKQESKNENSFSSQEDLGGGGVAPSGVTFRSKREALRASFVLDVRRANDQYQKFKANPVTSGAVYLHLRESLWAHFLGFYGSNLLSQYWSQDRKILLEAYQDNHESSFKQIRDAFVRELKVIDRGHCLESKSSSLSIPINDLKAILRGKATGIMIRLETRCSRSVMPCCEFELGKFRFPTLGLGTIANNNKNLEFDIDPASEIKDLGRAAELCSYGIATLDVFKKVVLRLINTKISGEHYFSMKREFVETYFFEEYELLYIQISETNFSSEIKSEVLNRMEACERSYFFVYEQQVAAHYNLAFKEFAVPVGVSCSQ